MCLEDKMEVMQLLCSKTSINRIAWIQESNSNTPTFCYGQGHLYNPPWETYYGHILFCLLNDIIFFWVGMKDWVLLPRQQIEWSVKPIPCIYFICLDFGLDSIGLSLMIKKVSEMGSFKFIIL